MPSQLKSGQLVLTLFPPDDWPPGRIILVALASLDDDKHEGRRTARSRIDNEMAEAEAEQTSSF